MALNTRSILTALVDHALTLGKFEHVNKHEPANSPGTGLTMAVWPGPIRPLPLQSGLAATSARIMFRERLYTRALQEPRDDIDPVMIDAVDALFNSYSGDFTLGGLIAQIDLLGAHGERLESEDGYLEMPDRTAFRVVDISVPVIINDVWSQEA